MPTAWQDNLKLLLEITHAPSNSALSDALGLSHTWFGKQLTKKYPAYLKGKTQLAFHDAFGVDINEFTTKRIPAKVVEDIKTRFATYAHAVGGVGWSPPVGQTPGDKFAQKAWEHETDEPDIEDFIKGANKRQPNVRQIVNHVMPRFDHHTKQIVLVIDDDATLNEFTEIVNDISAYVAGK